MLKSILLLVPYRYTGVLSLNPQFKRILNYILKVPNLKHVYEMWSILICPLPGEISVIIISGVLNTRTTTSRQFIKDGAQSKFNGNLLERGGDGCCQGLVRGAVRPSTARTFLVTFARYNKYPTNKSNEGFTAEKMRGAATGKCDINESNEMEYFYTQCEEWTSPCYYLTLCL